jgi:putative ABC transport system permease protein
MFKNYFVTAFRNIWRDKSYAAISILGLSIGMAVAFVVALLAIQELS